eukprot:CAMPEP_0176355122 /NCGR_PEP_ID=MMETSP0126-20121128/13067_1 /TAXON_ID=141414 ORGANISM="Strombidinopsis acuminatum, Strain SPMC142" /NCGR_SAMPLE_ID=MMETSP0126 /ASSEMBLY_ACC=CAM_ASM_000229 /LENGTH=368 /DNA_ID=CAMNT_0017707633 /DNA_START=41 /DNA_END=1147 /DNA_ORIENTATION=+
MNPLKSPRVYPRLDNVYKHKKSLNYDAMRSKIMVDRPKGRWLYIEEWIAYFFLAIGLAVVSSLIEWMEHGLIHYKVHETQHIIDHHDLALGPAAWAFFAFFSAAMVFIAAFMTVYIGPGSYGSGVAELMGYLNGVNYTSTFGGWTLFVKVFAVVFAVAGGLCIGKEGPLAHIGANVAMLCIYLPINGFEYLRNDVKKREYIAAGTSAGVSAAFGAPIGGTLFAFEISKPNTFWSFDVIWRVFFCCALSTFLLGLVNAIRDGEPLGVYNSSVLKFGYVDTSNAGLGVIPASMLLGLISGLLGAGFVEVNSRLSMLRKKYIKSNWLKIFEACCFSFATATAFYWTPVLSGCKSTDGLNHDALELAVQYDC